MTQEERRVYLIKALLSEKAQYQNMEILADVQQQKRLLRALFNVRMTAKNSRAVYACINRGEAFCPKEIERQSVCIDEDINSVFQKMLA